MRFSIIWLMCMSTALLTGCSAHSGCPIGRTSAFEIVVRDAKTQTVLCNAEVEITSGTSTFVLAPLTQTFGCSYDDEPFDLGAGAVSISVSAAGYAAATRTDEVVIDRCGNVDTKTLTFNLDPSQS